jgi:hypothetical protein
MDALPVTWVGGTWFIWTPHAAQPVRGDAKHSTNGWPATVQRPERTRTSAAAKPSNSA